MVELFDQGFRETLVRFGQDVCVMGGHADGSMAQLLLDEADVVRLRQQHGCVGVAAAMDAITAWKLRPTKYGFECQVKSRGGIWCTATASE